MPSNPKKTLPRAESVGSAEAVTVARRSRWNPLRGLTMASLASALEQFQAGDLKAAALLWETIAERDDTLISVKPKREKDVSLREWQVIAADKSPEAQAHQDTLQAFWKSVRATSAYDRNRKGGVSLLIRQMMEAVSMRYSVHHILWQPSPAGLRATFEHVPLWFFENRTGILRFIPSATGLDGQAMTEGEWLVHVGDGLMIAASIAYAAKRITYQDWLTFSEKFAMPGVVGKTSAAKGSPEGAAMKSAVESFGNDWAAVIYGDDGTAKIDLVQANGSALALPMPALIERVDKKLAAMYRGADLSTMSSGQGEGTGASLQGEEGDILLADDCASVSETLREIDRMVIEWTYGADVEPLAAFTLIPPVTDDKKFLLEAAGKLADRGVQVSEASVTSRLGVELVDPDDEDDKALGRAEGGDRSPDPLKRGLQQGEAANAVMRPSELQRIGLIAQAERMLADAVRADMGPLADEVAALLDLADEDFMAGAAALRAKLPGYFDKTASGLATLDAWDRILASATANGIGGDL
jgi:phage gp29-like protein